MRTNQETRTAGAGRARRRLGGFATALAVMAAVPAVASAAPRYVDDTGGSDAGNDCLTETSPCATLQRANDAANSGDQVFVAPGDYSAAGVNVTKNLRFRGAQAGTDARSRTVPVAEESQVGGFTLGDNSVIIDGFLVRTAGGIGVLSGGTTGSYTVENSIFRDNHHGISDQGSASKWTARHNLFENNNGGGPSPAGVWAFGQAADTVADNAFRHNRVADDGAAVNANGGDGLTVSGNASDDDANFVVSTESSNATIADNVVTNLNGTGVFLARGNVGVDILRNRLSTTSSVPFSGVSVSFGFGAPESRAVSIVGNTITGTDRGVNVAAGDDDSSRPYRGIVQVHYNRFINNPGAGVRNNLPASFGSVNAERNWFGCNAGPGAAGCTKVDGTGTTDANPWLVLSNAASPSSILTGGDTSTIAAGLRRDSDGAPVDTTLVPPMAIGFSTTLGTLDTGSATTQDGLAFAELTSGATPGTATVTATLDGESATTTVDITANAGPQGSAGTNGTNGTSGTNGTNGANGADGAPGSPGLPGATTPQAPSDPNPVTLSAAKLKATSKGVVKVKVTCPAAANVCEGFLTLKNGSKVVGRQAFQITGGKTGTVAVKLSSAAFKLLKKGKLKKLGVTAFSRDVHGEATTTARSVKVTR
ncbi:MAG: hypothetical protein QOJ07_2572 [Thermoleophilaceae bacterium]|nr:hypothetical protein [Thermoleophilaceae bacterium]